MTALAAVLLILLACVVLWLIRELDREPGSCEPSSWADAVHEDEIARRARAEALRLCTFEPFAWRVVKGGELVPTDHPGHVSGFRVLGGEVVKSHGWKREWDLVAQPGEARLSRVAWRVH